MPAYNCEKYVHEAIESIISQTYTSWELICIDDGSTDRTLEIMQGYATQDARIRLSANEQNRGRPYTRNRAIALARGELLAIQDADDLSLPHRLQEAVDMLDSKPTISVVGSSAIRIDEHRNELGFGAEQERPRSHNPVLGGWKSFTHASSVMRASAMHKVGGYDEFFALGQDYDLFLRMLANGIRFCSAERPWYLVRVHEEQGTIKQASWQKLYLTLADRRANALREGTPFDLDAEFEKLKSEMSPALLPKRREAYAPYKLGLHYLDAGRSAQARDLFRKTLRRSPLFLLAIGGYMVSLLPPTISQALIRIGKAVRRIIWR